MFPEPEFLTELTGRPDEVSITGRISQYGRWQVTQFVDGDDKQYYKFTKYCPHDKGHTHHERWYVDDQM